MHIILGGTGQVGSAVARALLRRGEAVTILTREEARGAELKAAGAQIAVGDVRDTARLRDVFRAGRRAFLLNPSAAPSGDTDVEERLNVASILNALEDSRLELVVAASTYGARPGERCGDLTVLYELEEGLRSRAIPAAINRGAYYMSNWLGMIDAVREGGTLPSFFPADFALPMVAPRDVGEAAARRMVESPDRSALQLHFIEGPERYTPRDVAAAFTAVLNKTVKVEPVPRSQWVDTFVQLGFSKAAAESYACMTGTVLDEVAEWPENPERGPTTLRDTIRGAIETSA